MSAEAGNFVSLGLLAITYTLLTPGIYSVFLQYLHISTLIGASTINYGTDATWYLCPGLPIDARLIINLDSRDSGCLGR
ncbi:hypothetical protein GGS26DRAFT_112953 [Hypomontagnella submonticulosa]|nr:hypothetical protein GGS26DRAFT_112953 [Hypomontagnella submonticulosa]